MPKHTFTASKDSLAVTTTYIFDAPREKVFAAYIDPKLIPKWWLEDAEIEVDAMDAKAGGSWRFTQRTPKDDFVFRGVYHRVEAPEQIVTTWAFEAMPGVFLETVTFADEPDGKTKVTDQFVFQTPEDRDMMLDTGMRDGSVGMMERLEKLIVER